MYKEGFETDIDSVFPRYLAVYLLEDTNQSLFLLPTEEPHNNQMTPDVYMYNVVENSNVPPHIKCEYAKEKEINKRRWNILYRLKAKFSEKYFDYDDYDDYDDFDDYYDDPIDY